MGVTAWSHGLEGHTYLYANCGAALRPCRPCGLGIVADAQRVEELLLAAVMQRIFRSYSPAIEY